MVSVIIPVYNRAKTIRVCVRSILKAGFEDLEVILVDDGSTDSSLAKCYELAQEDSRVFVVHQENAGVSAARNKGIENAHGEWITFVDSDDAVAFGHFDLINIAEKENADLVQVMHANAVCNGKEISSVQTSNNPIKETRLLSNEEVLTFLFDKNNPYQNRFYFCHDKFFRSSILKQFNIQFPSDVSLGEDQVFVCEYLKYSSSMIHSTRQTSLRLQWPNDCRSYQLAAKDRGADEYLHNIEKNYNALDGLSSLSGNKAVKMYAAYYLLCRPFSFLVVRHFTSWHDYKHNWGKMKDGLKKSISLMTKEKKNVGLVKSWRVRILCRSLFLFGTNCALILAWGIRQFDYIKEGIRYRLSNIGVCQA